jgi:UDP-N-acetylmuramoylalanine--D-glutamate ligase
MNQSTVEDLEMAGVRALVIGLAREGTTIARYLAERGAQVIATDLKTASEMATSLSALAGLPLTFVLGEHPIALLDDIDIVFVSPGVPNNNPLLLEAQRRGLPVSSETRLFTRLSTAPIVGITGSSGKSTTSALVGEMLRASGRKTWVGGNIGKPLLLHLKEMAATDIVVMELSSFQLELLAPPSPDAALIAPQLERSLIFDRGGWSPHIAAVLNITPNHLDRHPSMESYIAAKAQILAYQDRNDIAVLGWDNPETRRMGQAASHQHVLWFSLHEEVGEGAFLSHDRLVLRHGGCELTICHRGDLKLLGSHNVANVLAASALAAAAGAPIHSLHQAATAFRGVEHRLELVREWNGARWYNDSIATTPERTIAALLAFDVPTILLAGGRDKHLSWDELAALAWYRVRHLVLFGEATGLIEREMLRSPSAAGGTCHLHRSGDLEEAVALAAGLARPGDVVLLSPGGTSFDAYSDFAARGDHFRRLVNSLESR